MQYLYGDQRDSLGKKRLQTPRDLLSPLAGDKCALEWAAYTVNHFLAVKRLPTKEKTSTQRRLTKPC